MSGKSQDGGSDGPDNPGAVSPPSATGLQKPLKPMAVVAILVLAAVLVGVCYWTVLSHQGPPPPTELYHTIDAFAAKCHGDFKQLSPADQARVRKMAPGDPAPILAQAYKHPF